MIALCLCNMAMTQQVSVTSGSVVPFQHSTVWNDISHAVVAHNGSVLFMDWANQAELYQLSPGATTPTTVMAPILSSATHTWWTYGMALDSHDTLYIADTYGDAGNQFYCVPYNPSDGTWDLTRSAGWGSSVDGGGVEPLDIAIDDTDALIVSTQSGTIIRIPVTQPSTPGTCGTPGTPTTLIKGLKDRALNIAVDHAGTVYFIEDSTATTRSQVVEGVYAIPAGSQIAGNGDGNLEPTLTRLDPPAGNYNFAGIAVDAAGNIYLSSSTSSPGGNFNGVLKVPNEGTPATPNLVWNDTVMVAPISAQGAVGIDASRGVLWIPSPGGKDGGWQPTGSTVYPGTNGIVEWMPGGVNLASTSIGTPGAAGTVFYSFSKNTTPATITISQPGSTSDFSISTYPYPSSTATTPTPSCTAGTQYQAWAAATTDNTAITYCGYSVALNPSLPGGASGELQMFDSSSNLISGSISFLTGVGQGPAASILAPAAEVQVASGLSSPMQVAADGAGNSYVADSALGEIVMFAAGSSASAGTPVISGLTAPTGVAVDGSGNVYVGASGSVYAIPYVGGKLWPANKMTLATGFGNHLNLAVDGVGNVYVADADNARVVKISNQSMQLLLVDAPAITVGSGFKSPSAVAVDGAGDLFVADGTNLVEITSTGQLSPITSALAGSITGLVVDPSGSVYVAQTGGILRIPSESGVLTINDAVNIAQDLVTSPSGLAMDRLGNLYVSYVSGGTAHLAQVGVNGSMNFGQVSPSVQSDPQNAQVFNIGNAGLTFTTAPVLAGPNQDEFQFVSASANACDTTGGTSVTAGAYCVFSATLTALDVGTRTATATIASNAANAPSLSLALSGTSVGNLTKSQTALSILPSGTLSYPANVTISAQVSSTLAGDTNVPTGKATLTLNGNAVGSAQNLQNGSVSFTLSNLNGGTYTAKISYKGDVNFSGSVGTVQFTVNPVKPTITSSTPDTYIQVATRYIITVKVASTAGTPTGSVTFMEGSKVADPTQSSVTLDASGNATFNTNNLALGTHNITAVYSGDVNFATITSAPITFQIVNPSVLITASPSSISVTAGVVGSTTLTLQPVVGFYGSVDMSCVSTTLPQYSECTFDNPVPTVGYKGASATVVVTFSTNVPVNMGYVPSLRSGPLGISLAGLFGVGLFGLLRARKRGFRAGLFGMLCLAILLPVAMIGVSSCNNSGYTQTPPAPHVTTPSGTYTVSIIAIDPQTQKTVSLPFTMSVTVK
jgi:sugar lactone lactonase YvrE